MYCVEFKFPSQLIHPQYIQLTLTFVLRWLSKGFYFSSVFLHELTELFCAITTCVSSDKYYVLPLFRLPMSFSSTPKNSALSVDFAFLSEFAEFSLLVEPITTHFCHSRVSTSGIVFNTSLLEEILQNRSYCTRVYTQ